MGLANLAALAWIIEDDSPTQTGKTALHEALPVLATVVAGLITSGIVLKWFEQAVLVEKSSNRYPLMVMAACLCRVMIGGLLAAALVFDKGLVGGLTTVSKLTLAAFTIGLMNILFGLGLGSA